MSQSSLTRAFHSISATASSTVDKDGLFLHRLHWLAVKMNVFRKCKQAEDANVKNKQKEKTVFYL